MYIVGIVKVWNYSIWRLHRRRVWRNLRNFHVIWTDGAGGIFRAFPLTVKGVGTRSMDDGGLMFEARERSPSYLKCERGGL